MRRRKKYFSQRGGKGVQTIIKKITPLSTTDQYIVQYVCLHNIQTK